MTNVRDPLASLTPEAWSALLRARLEDLDEVQRAYRSIEQLLGQVENEGDSVVDVSSKDLSALMSVVNYRFGELLVEAQEAYKREQPC